MSNAEVIARLIIAAVFFLISAAIAWPVLAERHGPLAAGLMVVVGGTAIVLVVGSPYWRRRD